MKSILQTRKECFLTGKVGKLHEHHVFGAGLRKTSEKYGLKIWLVPELHNMAPDGNDVHHNRQLSDSIKKYAQKMAMFHYGWSMNDWMRLFHKNYLEDEE